MHIIYNMENIIYIQSIYLWKRNPHRTPKSRRKIIIIKKRLKIKNKSEKQKINKIKKHLENRDSTEDSEKNKNKKKKGIFAAKCWFWRKNLGNLLKIGKKSGEMGGQKAKKNMFSRFHKFFLKNQHFAAKFPFFQLVFFSLFCVFFFLSLLLGLCFPAVFILLCFLIWFLLSVVFVWLFFKIYCLFYIFLGISNYLGIQIHNHILYTVYLCW